jgi:hypothetical membrane protein
MLVVGTMWMIMAITVAESLTPGYSISKYQISGLGSPFFRGTCTTVQDCLTGANPVQPSSAVFVSAVFLFSVLGIWCAYVLRRATTHRRFALGLAVAAAGWLAIGFSYVPFYLGLPGEGVATAAALVHLAGGATYFGVGWIAVLSTYRFTRAPMKYITVVLLVVSLVGWLLFYTGNYLGLGLGGMQRMGAYPLFLWSIAFGAYLTRGLD